MPGPEVDGLCEIAAQHGLHLVVGAIERVGSTLHCATVTIDDQAVVAGWRRTLIPIGTEQLVWGRGDRSMLRVAVTRLGRVAVAICRRI